jgi:serine protease Do
MSAARSAALLALPALVACACRPHVPGTGKDAGAPAADEATAAPATTSAAAARILYPSGPSSFAPLVERVQGGVVAVRAAAPVESGPAAMFPGAVSDPAAGSGFLVDSQGVYVLTTDRIASAGTALTVVLGDGSERPARVVGRDPRLDVALLALGGAAPVRVPPLPLGDSEHAAVGDWVLALGNPFGQGVTASAGIISGTGAAGSQVGGPAMGFRTYLQTDARIHRGNSGGPLIDMAGKVIGVAVATGDRPGEIGFAVPIHQVRARLDALREHGAVARSWLGIKVQPVTPELVTQLGLPAPAPGASVSGAHVTEVVAGSPALRGELKVGDVVLRWDGQPVDQRTLPWKVESTPVGRAVPVTVWRGGAEKTLRVTTERMPE